MAAAFRTFAIAEMVVETFKVFKNKYRDIMSGDYHQELLYDSSAGNLARECKNLGIEFRVRVRRDFETRTNGSQSNL